MFNLRRDLEVFEGRAGVDPSPVFHKSSFLFIFSEHLSSTILSIDHLSCAYCTLVPVLDFGFSFHEGVESVDKEYAVGCFFGPVS